MAGIGFRLQKLLVEEIYLSVFQGFFCALVITSGPWLIMVISLAVLSVFTGFILSPENRLLFNILLVHISVITIITTGSLQLFFTRVFSDKMYTKERDELPNVIMTNLTMTMAILLILVLPFFLMPTTFPPNITFPVKILTFCLVFTLNIIWVLMNYISASDEFLGFIKHYIVGSVLSVGLGGGLGYFFDFSGFFFGFFMGQAYIACVLFYLIIKVFGFPSRLHFTLISKTPEYRILLFSGFFLYMGMWVDKFIYWYGSSGRSLTPVFYYNPGYNDIFFVAFLLTTPIMAIFFISMETSFYKSYYAYHETHLATATLEKLNECCEDVKRTVKSSLLNLVQIQGMIIVLGVIFSKKILGVLGLSLCLSGLFNVILVGVFFHMLTLIVCILLFYFDLRRETMIIYLSFFCLNGLLTLLFIYAGEAYSGFGYLISSILVFVYSLWKLRVNLGKLNFLTLTRQKIPEHEDGENTFIPATGCYGRYYIKDGERILDNS